MTELASRDFDKFYYMQTRIIMAKRVTFIIWIGLFLEFLHQVDNVGIAETQTATAPCKRKC